MIRSFRSKPLKRFAATGDASKLAVRKPERIRRILLLLNTVSRPGDMDVAGLRFHSLTGRNKGRYSVWASENYRITFAWHGEDAVEVDLEDYH
ncbi:MAG TPA: type II toxin-antitoxin system RelE/ParE family toxin [Rhizomicrobium sp.]|jgi:proteic killer suppression protein